MAYFSYLIKRIFAGKKSSSEEDAAIESRLSQIEHDPHRHRYCYEVLDDMHFEKAELKHSRRAEHNARAFWGDKRADHPDDLFEDKPLPLHPSTMSDRQAEREHMIKASDNDRLYNYTADMPIIHDVEDRG